MAHITLKIENYEKTFKDFYELEDFVNFVKGAFPHKKVNNEQLLLFIENKYKNVPKKTYKNLQDFFNEVGV